MSKHGCSNCKFYKDYSTWHSGPDSECEVAANDLDVPGADKLTEEIIDTVYGEGLEWEDGDTPLCPCYQETIYPDYTYDMM